MHAELGTRVVRGLDWIWGDQDGEEGMLGTVVQIKNENSFASSVKVLWDHGGQGIYRCGENNACDLFVFCSPAVSKHGVGCDVCLKDVIGTRWSCKECPLTNLCTTCYMNDKHNLQHAFERFDASDKEGSPLPPRARSAKVEAKGFFPAAMVVRGLCWEWDDQDGGDGQIGKIIEIQEFHSKYRRNVARVQWMGNSISNVYRIGHNGKVDLKSIKPAPGGYYYKHHLPTLGEKSESYASAVMSMPPSSIPVRAAASNFPMEVFSQGASVGLEAAASNSIFSNECSSLESNSNIDSCSPNDSIEKSFHRSFNINDRVRIVATKDAFMLLQAGHGGWNASMEKEIGKIGVVHACTEKGDIIVTMDESNLNITLHPNVLQKVTAPKILKEGDSVRILSNLNIAKKLFIGQVGEWTDEITTCLGQIGKITKAYLDGNYRVVIGHNSIVIPSDLVDEKIQQITASTASVQAQVASQEIKMVQAAKGGDLQELKDILDANPQDVNTPSLDGTPLNAAIFEERDDIVTYLINKGADVNILDKNKHTALHHALSVGNDEIINLVISSQRFDPAILAGKSNLDFLQFSAVCGSLYGTKMLMKHMAGQMVRPSSGPSPLHFAVFSSIDLVRYLIKEAGYDINVRDLDQRTPLHIAILTSNLAAAMFLIDSGADINACDFRGNTALHMTLSLQDRQSLRDHVWYSVPLKRYIGKKDQLRMENKEIIRKLIEELELKKAWNVNDAVFGCYLIRHGADENIKNMAGSTAIAACTRSEVLSAVKKYKESSARKEEMEAKMQSIQGGIHANEIQFCSISSEGSVGYQECRLCRQTGIDAKFEPCGHSTVCLDCACYFCKCFICEEEVLSYSKKISVIDCLICDEKVAEVLFEPCKHVVCCATCAWRMAKCVHCKVEIKQKFDKNMQPLTAPSDDDSAKYDELLASLKNLEAKVKEIESVNTCTICLDRQKNVMFLCGHGTCEICSSTLELCPICRDPIEKKIPMF